MFEFKTLTALDFHNVSEGQHKLYRSDEDSYGILKRIIVQMDRLAPEGEDDLRAMWLAIPRGRIEDWCTFEEYREAIREDDGSEASYEDYVNAWRFEFPDETMWLKIWTKHSDEWQFDMLCFNNSRDYSFLIEKSRATKESNSYGLWDDKEFLEKFLVGITGLIDSICKDPDGYNAFVEAQLPKQYRKGKIKRSVLNEIAPFERLNFSDPENTIKAIKAFMAGEFEGKGLKSMTIREYCKWYRIAYNAFYGIEDKIPELGDLEFYERYKGVSSITREFDPDSPKDFHRFQRDHYGEILLSRTNIYVHEGDDGLLYICPDASYYAFIEEELNIIASLYKAGAPLFIHQPERKLAAIEGTDYVSIKENTYHDYVSGDEPECGSSIELPSPDEAASGGLEWTEEILQAVIDNAEWKKLDEVKPKEA